MRGTSAETFIVFQNGDDKAFVSSDVDENVTTADSVDNLLGVIDYIEKDLHLIFDGGRHGLLIYDKLLGF